MSLLPDHLMLLRHNLSKVESKVALGLHAEALVFATAMVKELAETIQKLSALAEEQTGD